jgi:hypothetical protein
MRPWDCPGIDCTGWSPSQRKHRVPSPPMWSSRKLRCVPGAQAGAGAGLAAAGLTRGLFTPQSVKQGSMAQDGGLAGASTLKTREDGKEAKVRRAAAGSEVRQGPGWATSRCSTLWHARGASVVRLAAHMHAAYHVPCTARVACVAVLGTCQEACCFRFPQAVRDQIRKLAVGGPQTKEEKEKIYEVSDSEDGDLDDEGQGDRCAARTRELSHMLEVAVGAQPSVSQTSSRVPPFTFRAGLSCQATGLSPRRSRTLSWKRSNATSCSRESRRTTLSRCDARLGAPLQLWHHV